MAIFGAGGIVPSALLVICWNLQRKHLVSSETDILHAWNIGFIAKRCLPVK